MIVRYELFSERELLSRLQRTRLRGFDRAPVYEKAHLEIAEQIEPRTLVPAQRFVLKEGVETIIGLHQFFEHEGIDIFALRGGIFFWNQEDGEEEGPIPLIPPVVEESIEPGMGRVLLINDGLHRVYTAMKLGRRINVVRVRNVPPDYPYYAYALPEGWAGVTELGELRDGFQKKEYRDPLNYKALFRDFNEVFPGVQKQRKQTNPGHLRAEGTS
jgi:hypothetical protein